MDIGDTLAAVGERAILVSFLGWQRDTLLRKCQGLSQEQLRERAVPPSDLSLLGLIRHLAEDERSWFGNVLGAQGLPDLFAPGACFDDVEAADPERDLATWREECQRADLVIAAHQLDDLGQTRRGQTVSMRWILVHMVEEYSRHNGHADLLRQRLDGETGY